MGVNRTKKRGVDGEKKDEKEGNVNVKSNSESIFDEYNLIAEKL